MSLMSRSKDVSNTHIPYAYLLAILFLLLQGTLHEYVKAAQEKARCHAYSRAPQRLSDWNIPGASISRCSMHPKQTLSKYTPKRWEMWWLKTQLAELPKCAGGALLCSLSRFLLRGEAGVGWRRFDHLGECGPKWLLGVRGEDNSSQPQKDERLTRANELPGWTELHHACFL